MSDSDRFNEAFIESGLIPAGTFAEELIPHDNHVSIRFRIVKDDPRCKQLHEKIVKINAEDNARREAERIAAAASKRCDFMFPIVIQTDGTKVGEYQCKKIQGHEGEHQWSL